MQKNLQVKVEIIDKEMGYFGREMETLKSQKKFKN